MSAGDSRRDLIAGAPGWNANTGRVYVVFSGAPRGEQLSFANADVIITGGAAGDRFGEATAAGYITLRELSPNPTRDLAVGAPGANGNAGAVYLYRQGMTVGQRLGVASAILTVTGAPANARLGAALATGDLDGDGFREIIIGAPGIGAVYVVHGGPTMPSAINLATPAPGVFFRIQGSAADGVGLVLAAGDFVNHAAAGGNTRYDLAIGAPFQASNAGGVYVILGHATNDFPDTVNLATAADAHFAGIDPGDQAGRTLQIPYVDKDRFADLLIGAPGADGPGNGRPDAGEVYVVWGAGVVPSRSLALANVTVIGGGSGFQEGSGLAFGEVNFDGYSDFVSLAPGASTAGNVHLFNSRARASWPASIDLASAFPDRRVIGDASRTGRIAAIVMVDHAANADDIVAGYPADNQGAVQISFSLGPVVTEAPMSRTVNPGFVTVFSAAATGSPLPSLQWQVSLNGSTWTNIAGATDGRLSFVAHPTDNGKWFRAVFTNSVRSATTAAALLNVNPVFRPASRADFDGDGRTDVAVWRPSTGTFFSLTSNSGFTFGVSRAWGVAAAGDKPFTGDIDGDGIVDLVVWRPGDGTWYWLTSGTGYDPSRAGSIQWGIASQGDIPILADFDGDGRQDFAVYRNNTGEWYWLTSSTNYTRSAYRTIQWGVPSLGDIPMVGDFDADGKQDITVYRGSTGEWFWLTSSTNYARSAYRTAQWGVPSQGDRPFTGDFDGDGKSELIVYRPSVGTWFWLTSSSGYFNSAGAVGQVQWGVNSLGDVPTIGDFNGDGRADIAVWRPGDGSWFWLTSSSGFNRAAMGSVTFGASTDIPMVK